MVNKQGFMFLFCTVFLIFVALLAVNATNINDTPTTISSNSDICVNNTISMNTSKDKSYFKNIIKNQTNKNINKDNLIKESKQVNSNKTITSNTQKSNTNKKSLKTTNNTLNVDTNGTETAYFFIHSNGELQENITEKGNSTEFAARNYIPQTSSGASSLTWDGTVNMSQIINDWHINSASTNWVVETKGQYALNKYIIKTPDGLKTFLKVNDTTKYVSEKQSKQILKNFYPDMYSKYYNSSYRIIETNYIYFPYSIKREKYDKLIHIDGIIIPYYVFELIPGHDKDPINNITKKPSTTKATILNSTYKNSKLNITVLDANTSAVIKNGTVFVTLPNGTEVMGVTDNNGNVVIPVDLSVGEYELPVTFMGNENYTVSNTTVLIIIQKIYTNIKVEATNTKVNKTNIIKVTLTNGNGLVGEKVVLTIDDKKYNLITKENGVATFTTYSSSIERNKVLVTVKYFGNENIGYDSCINSTEFNVEKLNTKITVNQISNAIIGQNITLTGNLTDEFGHIVSNENIVLCFEKDNKNITVSTNSNGTYTFTYNVYREGSFDVIIYYYGNTALNPSSIGFHTYVVKINTNITVNPVANTTVDKNVSIKGTLKDEFGNIMPNTNIKIRINNETYQVTTDAQGEYEYIYKTTMEDTLDVTVAYHGNNTHNPSIIKTSFNVRKLNTTLSIIPSPPLKDGDKIYIMGYLEDENKNPIANATITITFGNKVYNVTTDDKGKYTAIEIANSSIQQGVVVAYIGDNKYATSLNKTEYYVDKIYTKISVNNIDQVPVGSTVTINGTLKDEFGHVLPNTPIEIDINGKTIQFVTDENGNYAYNYTISEMKKASVSVSYLGNSTYYSSDAQTAITVRKIKTTITLDPVSDIPYGKNITISGILKDEFGKPLSNVNISVVINGEVKSSNVTTDNNGKYSMNVTKSNVGIKNIIVSYDGNLTHYASSNSSSLNVTTINTTITVNTTHSVKIGSSIIINGVLKDVYGNILPNTEVIIVVNGKEYTIMTNNEGYYEMPYTTYIIGSRLVLVKYLGNSTYNPTSNQTNFYVNPINTAITVSTNLTNGSVKFGQSILINGTVYDEFGNILPNTEVSIIIDEETYTTTSDVNGKYQFIRKSQSIGIKKVIVQYNGNYTYNPSSNEIYYTVIPLNTKIVINHVEDIKIGSSTYINGTIYDEFGNILPNTELSFLVNDNLVYNLSDSEGNFKFKYTPETAGIINVIVGYIGNSTHNPSANTTSFNVNKINTKLTVTSNNTIEIGKNTSIEGTLKDEFGHVLSNFNITLNIGGKLVNVTTNEFGYYKTTFIPTQEETISIIGFYGGNALYNQVENKTIINVTKINTTIKLNNIKTTTYGNNAQISGTLTDIYGNIISNVNVTLMINNRQVIVTTDEKGVFTYTYKTDFVDINEVQAIYYGNDTYKMNGDIKYFFVVGIETSISINEIKNTTMSTHVLIKGTLKDEFGNIMANTKVVLTVNNQMVSLVTDEFGHYTYDYITNVLGTNEVYVIYEGNNSHDYSTNVTSFNVRKISSIIDVNKISTIVIGNNVTVNGTLKDEFGNKLVNTTISLNINDKTVNVTTDNNGNYKYTFQTNKIEVNTIDVSYSGNDSYLSANTRVAFDVRKILTDVDINNISDVKINSNVVINGTLYDEYGNVMKNTPIKLIINNQTYNITTDNNGNYKYTYKVNSLNNTVEVVYLGNNTHDASYDITLFTANKLKTTVTVYPASGIIGENITLIAKITDEYGNLVNGGNLVFKLNGKTLREDGSFNSTANPLKLKVENGFVRYNLHLDMYLRNIKNVTASYSGSYIYESARAQEATVIVGKRMTQLNVTTSTTTVKQNTNITFTVKIADITPNAENRTINTGRVIFKINGKTIKDDDGNIVFSDIINNTATYTYHIPQGMASVDKNNTLRNYTVEAVYADKIYQETKNTTVFHVEKSDISIDINNVSVSKTDKTMNVTAKILDYQGNFVVGTNKICLKVNGVTLKDENNQTIYYTINNGVIDLKNIIIPVKNVNNITIVTGDRQAYNSGCNTTDVIFIKE